MDTEEKAIEEFFTDRAEREADLRKLDAVITKAAPELLRGMFGKGTMRMLAYGMYHYKYATGREGDWPLIGIANQKNYISLYICAVEKEGKYLAEIYADKLGKANVGKSCIRFKKFDDLNKQALKDIVRDTAAWFKDQPR